MVWWPDGFMAVAPAGTYHPHAMVKAVTWLAGTNGWGTGGTMAATHGAVCGGALAGGWAPAGAAVALGTTGTLATAGAAMLLGAAPGIMVQNAKAMLAGNGEIGSARAQQAAALTFALQRQAHDCRINTSKLCFCLDLEMYV